MPASGPGWGGPTKGASTTVGMMNGAETGPGRIGPNSSPERRMKLENKQASAEAMYVVWEEIALNPEESASNRINAAEKLVNHVEGMAVQRLIAGTTDTVEEIRTRDPVEASRTYQKIIGGK